MMATTTEIDDVCKLYDPDDQTTFVDAATKLLNKRWPGHDDYGMTGDVDEVLNDVERVFFDNNSGSFDPNPERHFACPGHAFDKVYGEQDDSIAEVASLRIRLEFQRGRLEARKVFALAASEKAMAEPMFAEEVFIPTLTSDADADDEDRQELDEEFKQKGFQARLKLRRKHSRKIAEHEAKLAEGKKRRLARFTKKLDEEAAIKRTELRELNREEMSENLTVATDDLVHEYGRRLVGQKRKREKEAIVEEVASKKQKLAKLELVIAQDREIAAAEVVVEERLIAVDAGRAAAAEAQEKLARLKEQLGSAVRDNEEEFGLLNGVLEGIIPRIKEEVGQLEDDITEE